MNSCFFLTLNHISSGEGGVPVWKRGYVSESQAKRVGLCWTDPLVSGWGWVRGCGDAVTLITPWHTLRNQLQHWYSSWLLLVARNNVEQCLIVRQITVDCHDTVLQPQLKAAAQGRSCELVAVITGCCSELWLIRVFGRLTHYWLVPSRPGFVQQYGLIYCDLTNEGAHKYKTHHDTTI